ncbi:hypothetical protein Tco_1563150 [Tanacetum coccineum]
MEFESTNSSTTAKLPILKLVPQTAQENGTSVTKMSVPVTAEEKTNKKNDVKARSLLLMALAVLLMGLTNCFVIHKLVTASPQVSTASPNVNAASPQVSTASVSDNNVYAFMVENPNGSNVTPGLRANS